MTSILVEFIGPKTVIITIILEVLNFDFFGNFTLENVKNIQNLKIQSCSYGQNGSFWGSKMTKIDVTYILNSRKILKFPRYVFQIGLPRSVELQNRYSNLISEEDYLDLGYCIFIVEYVNKYLVVVA